MDKLKKIQEDLNIVPTSLESWFKSKIEKNKTTTSWTAKWKQSQLKLQMDKQ